jgi:hypothetical protein
MTEYRKICCRVPRVLTDQLSRSCPNEMLQMVTFCWISWLVRKTGSAILTRRQGYRGWNSNTLHIQRGRSEPCPSPENFENFLACKGYLLTDDPRKETHWSSWRRSHLKGVAGKRFPILPRTGRFDHLQAKLKNLEPRFVRIFLQCLIRISNIHFNFLYNYVRFDSFKIESLCYSFCLYVQVFRHNLCIPQESPVVLWYPEIIYDVFFSTTFLLNILHSDTYLVT